MKIKLGKTYLTEDGFKVRIICTDRKSKTGISVVGLLTNSKDIEETYL